MKRTPLVSIGQGEYRRDYSGEEFRFLPLALFIAGLLLVSIVMVSIDAYSLTHSDTHGGARIDDTRDTAPMARSSALGS